MDKGQLKALNDGSSGSGGSEGVNLKFEHEFIEPSQELAKELCKKIHLGGQYVIAYKKFRSQLKGRLALKL